MIIYQPFSAAQVIALNAYQQDDRFHPFTCPGDIPQCQLNNRTLIATTSGWVCACGKYTQPWAHDFMAGMAAARDYSSDPLP